MQRLNAIYTHSAGFASPWTLLSGFFAIFDGLWWFRLAYDMGLETHESVHAAFNASGTFVLSSPPDRQLAPLPPGSRLVTDQLAIHDCMQAIILDFFMTVIIAVAFLSIVRRIGSWRDTKVAKFDKELDNMMPSSTDTEISS